MEEITLKTPQKGLGSPVERQRRWGVLRLRSPQRTPQKTPQFMFVASELLRHEILFYGGTYGET
jgi:hypothetical protein